MRRVVRPIEWTEAQRSDVRESVTRHQSPENISVVPPHSHGDTGDGGTVAPTDHGALTGVTSGQHHSQEHAFLGADHTLSGLTAGHVLKATGASSAAFGVDPVQAKVAAKGDVVAGTTANTLARVAVGADRTFLRADSGQSAGVAWGNPTAVLLSGTFAIDSTGVKTVTVAHGLSYTPDVQDVALTVIEDTAVDDWGFDLLKVVSVDATDVTVKVRVSTASATGGATAKLGVQVAVN